MVVVLAAMVSGQLFRWPVPATHFSLIVSGLVWLAYGLTQLVPHIGERMLFAVSAIVSSEPFQALMLASRPLRDVAVVLTAVCSALLLFARIKERDLTR